MIGDIKGFDNATLQFDEQESWIGKYQEAAQQKKLGNSRFKYLDDTCGFCREKYLFADQVIVLPCSHSLHEHCFASWNTLTCPYDMMSLMKKVSLLGYSLSFPGETNKLAIFLQTHQEKTNDIIKGVIQKLKEEKSEEFQDLLDKPEKFHMWASFIQEFLQDLLNVYAQDGQGGIDLDDYISQCVQNFIDNCKKLEGYMKEHNEPLNAFPSNEAMEAIDFTQIQELVKNPSLLKNVESNLLLFFLFARITISSQGLHNVLSYVNKIAAAVLNDPEFVRMSKEADRKFFNKHFKIIRNLPSEKDKTSYLEKMEKWDLQRLYRLTNGAGPTSLFIIKNIEQIENRKKWTQIVREASEALSLVTIAFMIGCAAYNMVY